MSRKRRLERCIGKEIQEKTSRFRRKEKDVKEKMSRKRRIGRELQKKA